MTQYIHAPMINVNEEDATLVEWFKQPDDMIHVGELLCVLETTKSTFELNAEASGYFHPIAQTGDSVKVGQVIAALTATKNEHFIIPGETTQTAPDANEPSAGSDQRWTKKVEILAARHQLNLLTAADQIKPSGKITEADLLAYLEKRSSSKSVLSAPTQIKNHTSRLLILGGGNVASLVLDILTRTPNQRAVGILDDNPQLQGKQILGVPVLGKLEQTQALWNEGLFDELALAVGNLPARADLFIRFQSMQIPFANIIDPTVIIGTESVMGTGNMIMAFCRLGPQSVIGDNNFLSAYINIEHHNQMGSHCTFGPNVYMSGGVEIGSRVRFGTGISIEPRLKIGDNVTIASGVILTSHVPANTVVRTKSNFSFHTTETRQH